MANFKTSLSIWALLFVCFQTNAQEYVTPVSISQHLGITSIKLEPSGSESRKIHLKANRISINEQLLDLEGIDYEFTKTDKSIELLQRFSDGQTQSLEFNGDEFLFSTSEKKILLSEENIESLSPSELVTVIVFANVLKEADVHFDDTEVIFEPSLKASIKYRQCDHVEVSMGASRSVTEKKCIDNVIKFLKTHTDCVKYGSCDTSCLWGDHLCVATAFFLCNGGTCFFN